MKLGFLSDFDFFTGVPDSLLRPLCDWLVDRYGIGKNHIIAANEGNAVALAAGYHLATGKVPVVYMQNSGEGNIINPVASLMNDKVYGIPCVFIVGWRGEPNVPDEPQHIYQGEVTVKLLEDMDIKTFIISKDTSESEVKKQLEVWKPLLESGKQVAFVVRKGALEFDKKIKYQNSNKMSREDIIKHIVAVSGEDSIISTTGKASRELFEIREANKQGHGYDFLTVGSMGHSSSIALGIALQKPDKKIWCIDGDGAALMHMGGMAVVGANSPNNLVHIVINNSAHETVGGMPTVADKLDLVKIAQGCGYSYTVCVDNFSELDKELIKAKNSKELCFIEVKCSIGSRDDLGRPTTTAKENKENFMKKL
ncbi:MAG: phosphonopyruvate decarboxylase [Clostridia bacterium]|nr:phosphonopyruvate decarboxylase [Clostridia bacterium]